MKRFKFIPGRCGHTRPDFSLRSLADECVRRYVRVAFQILLAASLGALVGCGSGSQTPATSNFSGGTSGGGSGSGSSSDSVQVSLASDQLTGGASTEVTVTLTQPAPSGSADVQLTSSNAAAAVPGTVAIPAGQTSATAAVTTSAVSASTSVEITATYDGSVSGAALSIAPPSTAEFTDSLAPASMTVAEGSSGTSKITTKIATGFNHALTLSASGLPTGVTVTFSPKSIAAPGAGASTATVKVASSVAAGSYSLKLTAADGSLTASSTLTLKVSASSSNPGANFKACWYKSGGHSYQGVIVGVSDPGTYSFNALLYSDTKCTVYADQFGYGQEIGFGTSDYIFWFDHYPDRENFSALWYVGSDTSACLVYNTSTPTCN
ncbi:MAG: hypothetical protein WAN03_10045 [Candidatus Sulfotelmatobacter sp.]